MRRRSAETRDALSAQQHQIAALARDGLSNAEIGARLFLSPRTVEWHLHHVFTKLGVGARRQLADALPGAASAGARAGPPRCTHSSSMVRVKRMCRPTRRHGNVPERTAS